jgi:hypothetical protein
VIKPLSIKKEEKKEEESGQVFSDFDMFKPKTVQGGGYLFGLT